MRKTRGRKNNIYNSTVLCFSDNRRKGTSETTVTKSVFIWIVEILIVLSELTPHTRSFNKLKELEFTVVFCKTRDNEEKKKKNLMKQNAIPQPLTHHRPFITFNEILSDRLFQNF